MLRGRFLKLGVSSAVINFNNWTCGILNVFHGAIIEPGYFAKMFCINEDPCKSIGE